MFTQFMHIEVSSLPRTGVNVSHVERGENAPAHVPNGVCARL